MKRVLCFLVSLCLVFALFHSCGPEDDVLDETLLYGKWEPKLSPPPVLHYRYDKGGKGVTWNPDEGYTDANGKAFTWSLVQSDLTQIHVVEMGGGIPQLYTVTELTATTLKYKDKFDSWSFTKMK